MSALTYFPGLPRREQGLALAELTAEFPNYDCFVIVAPTGTGKSPMGVAITRWAADFEHSSVIVTPNSTLQEQYERDYPSLTSLWGSYDYACTSTPGKRCGEMKKKRRDCKATCPHDLALAASKFGPSVMHTATYLGTRRNKAVGYNDLVIMDEAHTLIDYMRQHVGVRLWHWRYKWPGDLAGEHATHADIVHWMQTQRRTSHADKNLVKAQKLIEKSGEDVVVQRHWVEYRGRMELALDVVPISVRNAPPILWPRSVKKLVFFSATIWPKDIEELGVDKYRRVTFIYCDSSIPAYNRPVYYMPHVDLSLRSRAANLPQMAALVHQICLYHVQRGESGLVHVTYEEALEYRRFLTDRRYMWHDHSNKQQVLDEYIAAAEAGQARALVGSGLREGIDLKDNRARFQVITKIPFPNLGVPAVKRKADLDPEWYDLEAIKAVIQTSGRVCRGPGDYGATYILDPRFKSLYERREHLFPPWFREAIRWT